MRDERVGRCVRQAEEARQEYGAHERHVEKRCAGGGAEEVEGPPERDLAEVVRVPGVRPEAAVDEAARVLAGRLLGADAAVLLRLEVELLVVGERLCADER